MTIANYGDLKAVVSNYLNRSDLTTFIPDFITLAIQRINYGGGEPYPSQPIRIPAMQARATGTITASAIAFPTRFLEVIRLAGASGSSKWTLTYMPPDRYSQASSASSVPSAYTILNNEIETAGTGAATYTLDYYQAFAAFSADADTNWILTNAPGVYLYASLLESAPFLAADERIPFWYSLMKASISAVNRATMRVASPVARVVS